MCNERSCYNCNDTEVELFCINGEYYCEDCRDELFVACDDCGEVIDVDYATFIEDENVYVCESCCDYNFVWCDYHNRFERDDGYSDFHNLEGSIYCREAVDDGVIAICGCCGEVMNSDYAYWDDHNEEYYCEECYREEIDNRKIKEYHTSEDYREIEFHGSDSDLYFGFELEVNHEYFSENTHNDVASNMEYSIDIYRFEEDCSIGNGFEIISDPCTLQFLFDNYDRIDDSLSVLRRNDYKNLNGKCGLHVHISRDALTYEQQYKIVFLVEKFKKEFYKFSRREDYDHFKSYSNFIWYDKSYNELTFDFVEDKALNSNELDSTRYQAINLQNDNTLEFRLFASTIKTNTLYATFEMINNLVTLSNTDDEDMDKITFSDIVNANPTRFLKYELCRIGLSQTEEQISFMA